MNLMRDFLLATLVLVILQLLAHRVATAPPTEASTTSPLAAAKCDWLRTCPESYASPTTSAYSESLGLSVPATWPKR